MTLQSDKLYLIRSEQYIKIGIASDVDTRLSEMQVGNPCKLSIEAVFNVGEAQQLEGVFHKLYRHKRVSGEWYRHDQDEIMNIGRICKIYIGTHSRKKADYIKELSVKFKKERRGLEYYRMSK